MQPAPIKEQLIDAGRFASRMWIRWFQNVQNALNSSVIETVRITFTDSPYTIAEPGLNLVCDTDGGNISVTYPVGQQGAVVRVANVGSVGNAVALDGNGTELISGSLTQTLYDGEVLETRFDSTEGWN